MLVTKVGDSRLHKLTYDLANWIEQNNIQVFVGEELKSSNYQFKEFWNKSNCSMDMVVTLGGDGTVLYTSWLFQQHVPVVVPFHLGSLGFLTVFNFENYKQVLSSIFNEKAHVNMRMRFSCTVFRGTSRTPESPLTGTNHEYLVEEFSPSEPEHTFQVLNEVVVDRGPSAYISHLELYEDGTHLTTVQADGLVIGSPTGSTAYSLSAGGPLVHPQVSAVLVTPICPHTLSFRPMLLHDSVVLRVCVPKSSRNTAWASFDGRNRLELKQGDSIEIKASVFPFPTVCLTNQSKDWYESLSRCLHWNKRQINRV